MAKKSKKYPGVYSIKGKKGISYGIDYVHPQTGQRVRKILKAETEAEADDLRSIEIADAQRGAINKAYGIKAQGKPVLFDTALNEYLNWSRENKKSWKTDDYRAGGLRTKLGGKLLSDITAWTAEQYKRSRAKEVAQKTVNKELSLASQVFEKAIAWKKWEGGNPFDRKIRFRVKRGKKPGALSPEQVASVMNAIGHPVKRDMVAFAYYQGWRIGEIRKLRWEDVNLERGTAWVIDPKNAETAELPLDGRALDIIRRQDKRSEFVFCHKNGKPYQSNLHRVLKSAAEKAGVWFPPRKAWHILRRTWASNFLQAGGDVESLRVQGNWKDFTMPLWYAEAADEERRKAILAKMPGLEVNGRNLAENGKPV